MFGAFAIVDYGKIFHTHEFLRIAFAGYDAGAAVGRIVVGYFGDQVLRKNVRQSPVPFVVRAGGLPSGPRRRRPLAKAAPTAPRRTGPAGVTTSRPVTRYSPSTDRPGSRRRYSSNSSVWRLTSGIW